MAWVARASSDGASHRVAEASVSVLFHVEGRYPSLDPTETEWAVIEVGLALAEEGPAAGRRSQRLQHRRAERRAAAASHAEHVACAS